MWLMPDEDLYYERMRERIQAPADEPDHYLEKASLFLDEEIEDLEAEYKSPLEELAEDELSEIVLKFRGIVPETASYNKCFCCIDYEYMQEAS